MSLTDLITGMSAEERWQMVQRTSVCARSSPAAFTPERLAELIRTAPERHAAALAKLAKEPEHRALLEMHRPRRADAINPGAPTEND